jgi:hypothetical protein
LKVAVSKDAARKVIVRSRATATGLEPMLDRAARATVIVMLPVARKRDAVKRIVVKRGVAKRDGPKPVHAVTAFVEKVREARGVPVATTGLATPGREEAFSPCLAVTDRWASAGRWLARASWVTVRTTDAPAAIRGAATTTAVPMNGVPMNAVRTSAARRGLATTIDRATIVPMTIAQTNCSRSNTLDIPLLR